MEKEEKEILGKDLGLFLNNSMHHYNKICLLLFISFLWGCNTSQKKPRDNYSITLFTIGVADSATQSNKGFGINFYCYINLNNDSVFIRQKSSIEEPSKVEMKSGFIKNILRNDTLQKGLLKLKNLPNGEIKSTKVLDGAIYCGPLVYLKYVKNNASKYYIYRFHHLDSSINNLTWLIFKLSLNKNLKSSSIDTKFVEDSLIIPIVQSKDFKEVPIPNLKPLIKFDLPKGK